MKKLSVFVTALLLSAAGARPDRQAACRARRDGAADLEASSSKSRRPASSTCIIANGGTEARGPQNILAGHTIMSQRTAIDVAKIIGHTLVAPVMPIDVGATGVATAAHFPAASPCRRKSSRA